MILVIGGTGRLGGKVAELLRVDGHDVRIMTRSLSGPPRCARPGSAP
jgi:uncharacterized protein YbjT (DUF2867 family)